MHSPSRFGILAALLLSTSALTVPADTLLLIQDEEVELNGSGTGQFYTGTHDAELREETPDGNFDFGTGSSDPEFTCDGSDPGNLDAQVVMRFGDLSSYIPDGSTITSATLYIDIDNTGNDLELYQLAGGFSWDEATATWNNFGSAASDGVNTGSETVGGPILIDGGGNKVFIDVTATVQSWFAGAPNNGWAFIPTGNDGVDFDASENSDPADRPSLSITFTAPLTEVSIAADNADQAEGDSGSTAFTFTVTRSGVTDSAGTVDWEVVGSGFPAADAADFGGSLPSGTVSFVANDTSETVTVNVSGDTAIEPDETFTVVLSNASGQTNIVTDTATGTILADDNGVRVVAQEGEKFEGDAGTTLFVYRVERVGDTGAVATATYEVNGVGSNPANALDFVGGVFPAGVVNFSINESEELVFIPVQGDLFNEPDETFEVELTGSTGGFPVFDGPAAGTIWSDETKLSIAADSAAQAEGNSGTTAFTFTVSRVGDLSGISSAVWTVSGSGSHPADADDFGGVLPGGTVTFLPNDVSKPILVEVTGDNLPEEDETFTVTLTGLVGAVPQINQASATILADENGTEKFRLIWNDDPSTTAVIAWNQATGSNPVVHYGTTDHGEDYSQYPQSVQTGDLHTTSYKGMSNHFARLSGLQPATAYYFVIRDSLGTSPRMWFRTSPDTPEPFTFITGGDSRNNREPRQNANRLVAKLRPLFVAFNGDFTDSDTNAEWQEWFDDWQLTIAPDGRIFPIVPARGNHEDSNAVLQNLFDLSASNYYAVSFGGDLLRLYSLNSEIAAGGTQRSWLLNDLNAYAAQTTWLMANYHKPMRPHTSSKSEGNDEYNNWAQPFYDYGFDVVVESDTHMMKRTYPLRPDSGGDEGFVRDDATGTTYIGEGCWGAPLRSANDGKSWTRALATFNGFDWIHVYPTHIEDRTVKVDTVQHVGSVSDNNPFVVPNGLELWDPGNGVVLYVPFGYKVEETEKLIASGDVWKYLDDGSDQGTAWKEPAFDDSAWPSGAGDFGYGDPARNTVLDNGPASPNQTITFYFRKDFQLDNPQNVEMLQLATVRDDGVRLFLNGTEVVRSNLPAGPIDYLTTSNYIVSGAEETQAFNFFVAPDALVSGENILAAELRNRDGTSSDIGFDLELIVHKQGALFYLTYEGWKPLVFDAGDHDQEKGDDFDLDTINNYWEFVFGSDPKDALSGHDHLPQASLENGPVEFSYFRQRNTGKVWTYWISQELAPATFVEAVEGVDVSVTVEEIEGTDLEKVTLEWLKPNQPRVFLKVQFQ